MELFENKVGRPSNETIKKRRMFVASITLAVAVVLFVGCYALFGVNTGNLQGVTYKSGTSYTNLTVNESKIKINGCNLTVPITVKNNLSNKMNVQGISLYYNGGKELRKLNSNITLNGKVSKNINVTFNMSEFKNVDSSKYRYKLTIWNNINGKGYYYDYDLFDNKSIQTAIHVCKKTTGTTAPTYKSGTAYTDLSVVKNKITISGCNVIIPITIKNNLANNMTMDSASLYCDGGKEIQRISVKKAIAKKTKITTELKFDLKKITDYNNSNYKLTIWNTFSGKGKYYDYDLFSDTSIKNAAKACNTTLNQTVKPSTKISCKITKTVIARKATCTTVAGATIKVSGPKSNTYKADSSGKVSFSLGVAGTYTVESSKTGYTPSKLTIK